MPATNSDRHPYFEMEIHAPLVNLKPGESFELRERQRLVDVRRWPERAGDVGQYLTDPSWSP